MGNPTKWSWVNATANVPDPITGVAPPFVESSITGNTIGVRNTATAGSVAGTYPIQVTAPANVTVELMNALSTALTPGNYASAIMTDGDGVKETNSAWSAEQLFTIEAPPAVPLPPSGFTVA